MSLRLDTSARRTDSAPPTLNSDDEFDAIVLNQQMSALVGAHRSSIPTHSLFSELSPRQELTKVMLNMALDNIASHVHLKVDELLTVDQTLEDSIDQRIRRNTNYQATRRVLTKLVSQLLFKNKRVLYEYVDTWVSHEILSSKSPKKHKASKASSCSTIESCTSKKKSTASQRSTSSTFSSSVSTSSSDSLNPVQIIPKMRSFFRLVIDRSFADNCTHSFNVKNWLMISTCHMIGVIICECYHNKTLSQNVAKGRIAELARIVASSVSDYIVTNHTLFIESVGGWVQLRGYRVNDMRSSSQILVPRESFNTSSTGCDDDSFTEASISSQASRADDVGAFNIPTSTVLPIIVATALGIVGYKHLKKL